jgi:hypothetical protein
MSNNPVKNNKSARKGSTPVTQGPNQSKKNSKKARRRELAPVQAGRAEKFFLSMCSRYYLRALCDPFSLMGGLACIPDLIDAPSQKMAVKARGTFSCGASNGGIGFVAVNVFASTNNVTSHYATSSTFTGTNFNLAVPVATGVGAALTAQFPYTATQLPSLLQRTVGCGLRVRYMGTELNRAGRLIGLRVGTSSSVNGLNSQTALSINSVQSVEVSKKWTQVFWLPTGSADYEYDANTHAPDTLDDPSNCIRLGFFADGCSNSSPFEYEVIWHKEYSNRGPATLALNNLTTSHSDIQGLSAVRNYFEGAISYLGGTEVYNSAIKYISSYSPADVSHVITGSLAMARLLRN